MTTFDGIIKLKFHSDHPESQALKNSIDRTLNVPEARRNDWKSKNDTFSIKYTVARHHFTKQHLQKFDTSKTFNFFKPFSIHGARKYLYTVDPQETIIANDQVLYLQCPNVPKEYVKNEFQTVMRNHRQSQSLENKQLKDQLDAMKSQLTFLHDMVQKLQEQHIDTHSVAYSQAHSQRRRTSRVPQEIRLDEEEDSSSCFVESTEGDWTDQYESESNINRRRSQNSFTSMQSKSTIVSASKSVKTLPREMEMDELDSDDEDLEALELRSFASSKMRSRASFVSTSRRGSKASQPNPPGPTIEESDGEDNDEDTEYKVSNAVVTDPYGEKGTYTGSISRQTGMPHGYGRLEYNDKAGRWYEGDWKHGRWTGQGELSNGDGDYYSGALKNDHKHGLGLMKFADGRTFEGTYEYGQMVQGKMTYQDGSTYSGSWVDGMRHGFGKCVFTDNSIYEGEFREGEFFGQGRMTWNDGGWYEGMWESGEMHGQGKEVRADGSLRHDGEWVKGQPIRHSK